MTAMQRVMSKTSSAPCSLLSLAIMSQTYVLTLLQYLLFSFSWALVLKQNNNETHKVSFANVHRLIELL